MVFDVLCWPATPEEIEEALVTTYRGGGEGEGREGGQRGKGRWKWGQGMNEKGQDRGNERRGHELLKRERGAHGVQICATQSIIEMPCGTPQLPGLSTFGSTPQHTQIHQPQSHHQSFQSSRRMQSSWHKSPRMDRTQTRPS